MGVDVDGADKAIARLERLERDIPRAGIEGARATVTMAFAATQAQVPRRTERLALTGFLGPVVDEGGDNYSISASYGPTRYAAIMHFGMRYHHRAGEKAYFLSDPFKEFEDAILQSMANAIEVRANV